MTSTPTELYLILRKTNVFENLNEDIILSLLHLCDEVTFAENSVIAPEKMKLSYVYLFIKGTPESLKATEEPHLWGIESVMTDFYNPSELLAPPGGTHALLIHKSKMKSLLNEAPELLINILKHT